MGFNKTHYDIRTAGACRRAVLGSEELKLRFTTKDIRDLVVSYSQHQDLNVVQLCKTCRPSWSSSNLNCKRRNLLCH
jgi:hypothetical protein